MLELYAACYGRESEHCPSPAEWDWRYHNALYKSIIWLAKCKGRVVALRPAVVRIIKIGHEYFLASHFMDAMTHPNFRRRGLFTHLIDRAVTVAEGKGIDICYTFPNEKSFPIYAKKPDWTCIGFPPIFVKPINIEVLLREKVRNQLLRSTLSILLQVGLALTCRKSRRGQAVEVNVRRLAYFDERFNAFWEQVANDYEVIIQRDSQYLNWRYMQRPSVEYTAYVAEEGGKILGFIVVRSRRISGVNLGIIAELLTLNRNQEVAQALIARGVQHLVEVGVDAVTCAMFPHQPYHHALRREGFICVPQKLLPRQFHFVIRVNRDSPVLKKVLDHRNWFLSWGDNDAV